MRELNISEKIDKKEKLKLHFRSFCRVFFSLEELFFVKAEHASDYVAWEPFRLDIVVPCGFIVPLPGNSNPVLSPSQLILQAKEVLSGLQLRVVLHIDVQARERVRYAFSLLDCSDPFPACLRIRERCFG